MSVVGGIDVPLHHLLASEARGDLRGEDALAQGASQGRRLREQQQVVGQFLRQGGMRVGVVETAEEVARMPLEARVCRGDGRVHE